MLRGTPVRLRLNTGFQTEKERRTDLWIFHAYSASIVQSFPIRMDWHHVVSFAYLFYAYGFIVDVDVDVDGWISKALRSAYRIRDLHSTHYVWLTNRFVLVLSVSVRVRVKVCLQVIMYINFAIVWALFNFDRQWNALQIIIITQNLFNIIVSTNNNDKHYRMDFFFHALSLDYAVLLELATSPFAHFLSNWRGVTERGKWYRFY